MRDCALSIISACDRCISTSFSVKSIKAVAAVTLDFFCFLAGFSGSFLRLAFWSGDGVPLLSVSESSESSAESFDA